MAPGMKPRVSAHEKKLHLSYDLSHRVHCAAVYPITAPNGSAVIVCGHERGITVRWRGGLRHKARQEPKPPAKPNGISNSAEVIVIDDSDDEQPATQPDAQDGALDDFEDEEEELDHDEPYPPIIYELDIDYGHHALSLAFPPVPQKRLGEPLPPLLETHLVVAVAFSNKMVKVLTFPLLPPRDNKHADEQWLSQEYALLHTSVIPRDVAVTWTSDALDAGEQPARSRSRSRSRSRARGTKWRLLVAVSFADIVHIHRVPMTANSVQQPANRQPHKSLRLPASVDTINFTPVTYPSPRHAQLLITDSTRSVRIYDLLGTSNASRRPPSRNSSYSIEPTAEPGRWLITYQTSFTNISPPNNPALAQRKKLLQAKWVADGRCILALLEDGEWGIWNLSGSQRGGSATEFTIRGFIGTSAPSADTSGSKKVAPKLAPMTPNTRSRKQDALFRSTPSVPGVVAQGGISVTPTNSRSAQQPDESVVMWYNGAIYSIPSMAAFIHRSAAGGANLYRPGLTRVEDVELFHESIMSIAQFASRPTLGGSLGQMSLQRDLLVAAEHRFVVTQSLRQPPAKGLFDGEQRSRPTSSTRDQSMLEAGELDVGGLDRMLDVMASAKSDDEFAARPRRVGFAQ